MRAFKSLLVSLIGLTALMYAVQNLSDIGEMRQHIGAVASPDSYPQRVFSHSPILSGGGLALIILCQFAIAVVALKGAWELYAARRGTPDQFREAKSTAVWAGGLSLLGWFAQSIMIGLGLFQWGTDNGADALAKSFALGTTSALTILFVWGTRD